MNKKGFTLIEVLLAVFIIIVGVLALYNGINYAYNSIQKAKDQFTASYLASEGLELVKNIRDSNYVVGDAWDAGLLNCLTPYGCKIDYNDSELTTNTSENDANLKLKFDEDGFYNYINGDGTIFSRKIFLGKDGDKLNVAVKINWPNNEFLIQETLYDWK